MNNDKLINEVNKISGITEQLDSIVQYNVSKYCVGNGVYDDTVNLQLLINKVNLENKHVKLIFDVDSLYLTNTFNITKSNTEIDFCNCDIKFEALNNLNDETKNRYLGIFNFIGNVLSDTKIINSYEKLNNYNAPNSTYSTKLYLNDVTNINVNDYTQITLQNEVAQTDDTENAKIDLLAKVVGVDTTNKYVLVDIDFPYEINLTYGRFKVINTINNVTIKNYKYTEITNISSSSTSEMPTDDVLLKMVNGLFFKYCSNIKCYNINSYNSTNVNVFAIFTHNIYVEDVNNVNPRFVCPGRGYAVQFNNSLKCYAKNINGINSRHLIDFTATHQGIVENASGEMLKHRALMTHGTYENDIIFINCIGSYSLGAGSEFGNASYNVKYINCKLISGGFNLSKYITVENSEIVLNDNLYSMPHNINFINSKVVIQNTGTGIKSNRRFNGGSYVFNNCDIGFITIGSGNIVIDGLDYFNIYNSTLYYLDTKLNKIKTGIPIKFNVRNVNIVNSIIDSIGIKIDETKNLNLNIISELLFDETNLYSFIDCDNYCSDDVKIFINLQIKLKYNSTITRRLTRFMGTPTTKQNMFLRIKNSNIVSTNTGKINIIPFRNSSILGSAKYNTQINDNVFIGVGKENFEETEYPNNIWINS